jgi:peptide-methionine (R)-S-oxide reductase
MNNDRTKRGRIAGTGETTAGMLDRRAFLFAAASAAAGAVVCSPRLAGAGERAPKQVRIVEFSDTGQRLETVAVPIIVKTDAEWRRLLSPASFAVARKDATERPFSGQYWNLHDKGLYRCLCCDTALFNSETKFESGTGWPSFWQPIAKENVHESSDDSLGMMRIAVSCRRCDAHLGHVFNDGPRPTGLRYCMNSLSLRFVKFA